MFLNASGKTGPSRVSNTTVKCFVMLMFYGEGNGKVLKACVLSWLLTILKTLTVLITNMGKSVWMVKIGGMNAGHLLCIEIMGACSRIPIATPGQGPMEMHYVH